MLWQYIKYMTTEEDKFHKLPEGDLIAELLCISGELGGKMERIDGYRSDGHQYKKIVIEYDLKEWKRNEI